MQFLLGQLLGRLIRHGTLTVIDARGRTHVYAGEPGPQATIRLHDPALYRKLFWRPDLCGGEAYVDGTLTVEAGGLRELLKLFWINRQHLDRMPTFGATLLARRLLRRLRQHNPIMRARHNVAHHYDLSRQLYELFLDADMQYSCAYFAHPDMSLEEAQQAKKRHIAAKLQLAPGQRILDIGSGWGGLALYLAAMADVEVLGVTLSTEQHAVATARAEAVGLSDRVSFEVLDYRHVAGSFDRIVSVGMFEHVGVPQYHAFFRKIRDLLTDDGVALLHSIGHSDPPSSTNPWLEKYIFPGGYSPSLSEVLPVIERNDLWVLDCEILRLHYAKTIDQWHRRFQENRARIAEIYDERFCRMWEFYLTNVELVFSYGSEMVFQLQLGRRRDAVPITRDYIGENEAALAAKEQALAARLAAASRVRPRKVS